MLPGMMGISSVKGSGSPMLFDNVATGCLNMAIRIVHLRSKSRNWCSGEESLETSHQSRFHVNKVNIFQKYCLQLGSSYFDVGPGMTGFITQALLEPFHQIWDFPRRRFRLIAASDDYATTVEFDHPSFHPPIRLKDGSVFKPDTKFEDIPKKFFFDLDRSADLTPGSEFATAWKKAPV